MAVRAVNGDLSTRGAEARNGTFCENRRCVLPDEFSSPSLNIKKRSKLLKTKKRAGTNRRVLLLGCYIVSI
jgi:hypothetical protein